MNSFPRPWLALACLLTSSACVGHPRLLRIAQVEHGVSVIGVGSASGVPDVARLNLGVEVRAGEVERATGDAAARMNATLAALKQLGIAEHDLRTHSLSIDFEPAPVSRLPDDHAGLSGTPPTAAALGNYRVTNMLTVTIHDLNSAGRVLHVATQAGANNVWGIEFELENSDALKSQARAQAVERAHQAAIELASLSGLKLGRVIAVSEDVQEDSGPVRLETMNATYHAQAELPIERGEVRVSYAVRVHYATKEE